MTALIYQQLYGEYKNAQKNQMFVLDPHYKSLQFPTFLRVHPPSSALGSRSQTREAVAGNVDSWRGRL